jgi:GDPmannose 4,6-dehydratase
MKCALITGVTGQDGSCLAEMLIDKGYRVIGTVRDVNRALTVLPDFLVRNIKLVEWDMLDQNKMIDTLSEFRPTELYNFAAYSSGSGMYDDPVGIGNVNGIAVAKILEAIRITDKNIRFCQASSREIFGVAIESPQTELTIRNPRSPYGAAKLYADSMVRIYRQHYGLFACSAILFNHESPRRGLGFVTRKITNEAARIKLGLAHELLLGNLDARRDWGFAGDIIEGMWLMLQQVSADDYVLATGKTHTVREFCETAFACLDMNYLDYVREDVSMCRPDESVILVGNADKAKENLGWIPRVGFRELVSMMVEADLQSLSKFNMVNDDV